MPAGPRLDVSEDYNLFDNQEDVLLVNPDGAKLITTALREEVDTVPFDVGGGAIGYRSYTTWHVFRNRLYGFVPKVNAYIQDPWGVRWFVGACNLQTWGTRWRLSCEAEAGEGTRQIWIPTGPGRRIISSGLVWDTPNGDRTKAPLVWENLPQNVRDEGRVKNAHSGLIYGAAGEGCVSGKPITWE